MKLKKMRNSKSKIFALLLLTLIVLTSFISITFAIPPKLSDELVPNYLYEYFPTNEFYEFKAEGECYIIAEVINTDYSSVFIDDTQHYEVSYGSNAIPITFSESLEIHNITLENKDHFESVTIEPLFLSEGEVDVSSGFWGMTIIEFDAGGLISILLKPNFSYNLLTVRIDDVVLKSKYDPSIYPEIDSQLYSYFVEDGPYIRFDYEILIPKTHYLLLQGNGTVEYVIMANYDWDEDELSDVYEVQKEMFSNLDPAVPDIWGFFEKAGNEIFLNISSDTEFKFKDGYFSYYIPQSGTHYLTISVHSGKFFNFELDGDLVSMKNVNLTADSSPIDYIVPISGSGWHYIRYKYHANYSKILFRVNGIEVKVVNFYELIDTDGDGMKDGFERTNRIDQHKIDNDSDGLPDNYDPSPFASLICKRNEIYQTVIPTNPDKHSTITIQIKKPEEDYSTYGIPRLWHNRLNVSIYPVLRLFGNKYELYIDSPEKPLTRSKLEELWGKSVSTYSIIEDPYDYSGVGDSLPITDDPDSEFHFIFPSIAEETFEYELTYSKDNSAKDDRIIDLRFDFIWLVLSYDPLTKNTKIIHYYDFEEDITIQAFTNREISEINYLLASPDNFVENQILWNLRQNPSIGTPAEFNVDDDIIGQGTVDFLEITNRTMEDLITYYENYPNERDEAEVSYFSGLQDNYDILDKIKQVKEHGLDSYLLNRGDFQTAFSFYAVNDVYENQNYSLISPEIQGDYRVNYKITSNIFYPDQKVAIIFGMPIAMKRESYLDSEVLIVTHAVSELISVDDIPYSLEQLQNDNVKIKYDTYIEAKTPNERIPFVNFNFTTDIHKEYFYNRANEIEQGKLFFEEDSISPSDALLLYNYIEEFKSTLEELHLIYSYFSSENGLYYYPGESWDIYREYDQFLNYYKDKNGQYLTGFLKNDVETKLQQLYNLELEIANMLEQQRDIYKSVRRPDQEDPSSDLFDVKWKRIGKRLKTCRKNINTMRVETKLLRRQGQIGTAKYAWLRLKNNAVIHTAIGFAQIGFAIYCIYLDILEMIKLWTGFYNGTYKDRLVEFGFRVGLGICSILISGIVIFEGVIRVMEATGHALSSTKSFLCKLGYILAFIMLAIEWGVFIWQAMSGELSGKEFEIQLNDLIVESIFMAVTLALLSLPPIGTVIAFALITISFIGSLFDTKDPSLDVTEARVKLPDRLKLRRRGSFEVGDDIEYRLEVKNDGDGPGWIRARFKIEGDDWESQSGWREDGDWDDHDWPWDPGFEKDEDFDKDFSLTMNKPSSKLKYKFELDYDWERLKWHGPVPWYYRMRGIRENIKGTIEIPILQTRISSFYADTTELYSSALLKEKFEEGVEEYRYKDAYESASEIISMAGDKAKISLNDFNHINNAKQFYRFVYEDNRWIRQYYYQARDLDEFMSLMTRFYDEGLRAIVVYPDYFWFWISHLPDKIRHMISYSYSDGKIIIPAGWFTIKSDELTDAFLFDQLRNELPLKTNIKSGLGVGVFEIDHVTKTAEINYKLKLEGPDDPIVNISLISPDGFSIFPNKLTQSLSSELSYTIFQENSSLIIGVYYFEMNISLNDRIIYRETIPFRIQGLNYLDFEVFTPPEPINLGEICTLIDVINRGTIPENVKFIVEGIPENYIYKDLYPGDFINTIQYFNIYPGESRESLVILPPSHYTTIPGLYEYNVTAINLLDNSTFFSYEGTFEIVVFHELEFTCSNQDQLIYDYETVVYNFEVTNIGNLDEHLVVTYDDVDFATLIISSNNFLLAPGETQSFSIALDPFDLGSQDFRVEVSNEFISREIICSLEVIDDDTINPYFENIYITDDYNWLNISFYGLDELFGDDMGLSLIEIYVDGELIFTYLPTATETVFDFSFVNDWIWEVTNEYYSVGQITHEIRVVIVDSDDDRISDDLSVEFYNSFKVTLDEIYDYVIWLLGEVNQYIYDNNLVALYGTVTQKLVRVQGLLGEAYQLIEAGELHTGLVRDKIAEAKLEIAEAKAELKNLKGQVGEPYISEILSMTHEIRIKIVELMGLSVGTEFGHDLSLTEVDLYNLRDLIEENIIETDRESLFNNIALAAAKLEDAIFDISLGKDTENSMIQALHALDHAIAEVIGLARKGKISLDLKMELLSGICIIRAKIVELMRDI